ncbi:MAG: hypothetical protein R3B40_23630 [Polyangiales bacterium]
MRSTLFRCLVLSLGLSACGDASIRPEPLLDGATLLLFGDMVEAVNGIATVVDGAPTIILGTGEVGCGSEEDLPSLSGVNVAISLPSLTPGSHDITATFYRNVDGERTSRTVTGRFSLYDASEDSMTVAPQIIDMNPDEGNALAIGRSTVVRCAN